MRRRSVSLVEAALSRERLPAVRMRWPKAITTHATIAKKAYVAHVSTSQLITGGGAGGGIGGGGGVGGAGGSRGSGGGI